MQNGVEAFEGKKTKCVECWKISHATVNKIKKCSNRFFYFLTFSIYNFCRSSLIRRGKNVFGLRLRVILTVRQSLMTNLSFVLVGGLMDPWINTDGAACPRCCLTGSESSSNPHNDHYWLGFYWSRYCNSNNKTPFNFKSSCLFISVFIINVQY